MNKKIHERRSEMLRCYNEGLKVVEWAPILSSQFEVSEETLRRDWSRRHNWLHFFVNFDDSFLATRKLIAENEALVQDANALFEEADDPKTKLQFMWLRLKIFKEQVSMLKELGLFGPVIIDFEHKAKLHKRNLDEKMYPYLRAERDREIRKGALKNMHETRAYLD